MSGASQEPTKYVFHHQTMTVLAKAMYDMKTSKATGVESLRELANNIRKHSPSCSVTECMKERTIDIAVPTTACGCPFVMSLIGPPGSGKGTISSRLEADHGFTRLSVLELLRNEIDNKTDLGMEAEEVMASGGLISDALAMTIISTAIKKDCEPGKRFLLYGYPRTVEQAIQFESTVCPMSCIVHLACDDGLILERNKTGNPDSALARLKAFTLATSKIKTHHESTGKFISVNTGINTEDQVYTDVVQFLEQVPGFSGI